MRRGFALVVLVVSAAYLLYEYKKPQERPLPPPPPVMDQPDPGPVFSDADVRRVRQSLKDGDPGVRWTAAQLLYNIRDPQLGPLLDKMIAEDPDPEVRIKVVGMMKGREDLVRLGGLVRALSDTDKGVRLQALDSLGAIGDPSVASWVTALLKDPEVEVRVAALQTLGKFQDKRKKEFHELADKLKKDYEDALRREAIRNGTAQPLDNLTPDFNK
jgi:HEAT repeat protein